MFEGVIAGIPRTETSARSTEAVAAQPDLAPVAQRRVPRRLLTGAGLSVIRSRVVPPGRTSKAARWNSSKRSVCTRCSRGTTVCFLVRRRWGAPVSSWTFTEAVRRLC